MDIAAYLAAPFLGFITGIACASYCDRIEEETRGIRRGRSGIIMGRLTMTWMGPLTALIWVLCVNPWTLGIGGLRVAVMLSLLLAIVVSDARCMMIPDQFTIGGTLLGFALADLPGGPGAWTSLVGASVAFALMYLFAVVGSWAMKKDAMGGGDIKMMAMLGAFLGPAGALLALFAGSALTLLMAPLLSWKRGVMIPFGVPLAIGGALSLFFSGRFIAWYLGFAIPLG